MWSPTTARQFEDYWTDVGDLDLRVGHPGERGIARLASGLLGRQ
jgi:hypothetical protein